MSDDHVSVQLDIVSVLDHGNAAGITRSAYLSCLMVEVSLKNLKVRSQFLGEIQRVMVSVTSVIKQIYLS